MKNDALNVENVKLSVLYCIMTREQFHKKVLAEKIEMKKFVVPVLLVEYSMNWQNSLSKVVERFTDVHWMKIWLPDISVQRVWMN